MSPRRRDADPVVEDDRIEVIRREEQLRVGTQVHEAGRVRVRKSVSEARADEVVALGTEHAEVERRPPNPDDTGEVETLADGTVSIPVFEERLVVEKRLVVRERIVVRKHTVSEEHRVTADLRREHVDVDVTDGAEDRVDVVRGGVVPPA